MGKQSVTEEDIALAIARALIPAPPPAGYISFEEIYSAARKIDPEINKDLLRARLDRATARGEYVKILHNKRVYYKMEGGNNPT